MPAVIMGERAVGMRVAQEQRSRNELSQIHFGEFKIVVCVHLNIIKQRTGSKRPQRQLQLFRPRPMASRQTITGPASRCGSLTDTGTHFA